MRSTVEAMTRQAEAARQSLERRSLPRTVAKLEAQARNNWWRIGQERLRENLANLRKLF
jgi:hypothetical protein